MYYIVSKLFTYLFLPPGIFIILLIIAAFKRIKYLFLISGLIFYFMSIDVGALLLSIPLGKSYLEHPKNSNCKEIVVLAGNMNYYDTIKNSADSFKRLVYGLELAHKKNLPIIFSGAKTEEYTQTDVKNLKESFNINTKIYYENRAKNTIESAKFVKELINNYNLSNDICLVTSSYRMKRAEIIFKHLGFNVTPMPTGFNGGNVKNFNPSFFSILPNEIAFHKSYQAIHEYFGILSLLLRGYKLF
jgi:uncharacterized SAM-binding protein YcdF (DUF218 family)